MRVCMAREDLHFRLRIPADLKDKIEEVARENGRSMTAEMIVRLEQSFGQTDRINEMDDTLTDVVQRIEKIEEYLSWATSQERHGRY